MVAVHTSAVRPTGTYQATRALSGGDPCRLTRLRRILPFMSDAVARLNAALEGRYAIERELRKGVIGEGRHTRSDCELERVQQTGSQNYEN